MNRANFVSLGSVAEFVNGFAFKPSDWGTSGSPIIRIQNLTDELKPFNRTNKSLVPRHLWVSPGDLLVSWSATLGVFEWRGPEVAVVNQHIFRVLPHSDLVEKRYLRHQLTSALHDMERHLHGATMRHVNRAEFLATKVFLPSLAEQRRIAKVLDRADALRAKRQAALVQLDDLTQSIFLDMFGDPSSNARWPRKPLADVIETIDSGWSPNCLDRPVKADEWGVLKLGAVTWGAFDDRANKALKPGTVAKHRLEVKRGDLLFTRKNTYDLVGATALVRATAPRLMLSDLIFRLVLRPESEVKAVYLWQLLSSDTKRALIRRQASGSAGSMPNISKARLLSIPIEVPPLELQEEFAYRIDALENHRDLLRVAVSLTDSLFASLQHRAFRGDI